MPKYLESILGEFSRI